jgi:hypothetical protein
MGLLLNTFGPQVVDSKLMLDSRQQRIGQSTWRQFGLFQLQCTFLAHFLIVSFVCALSVAFVEFDSIESSSAALPRIHGYLGMSAAFSKNPLNKRIN